MQLTPKTTKQNLLYWAAAISFALLISFTTALVQELNVITIDDSIRWRVILLSVLEDILNMAPLVAAGLGLPRLGKEHIASKVSQLGTTEAEARLYEDYSHINLDELAKRILDENNRRQMYASSKQSITKSHEQDIKEISST